MALEFESAAGAQTLQALLNASFNAASPVPGGTPVAGSGHRRDAVGFGGAAGGPGPGAPPRPQPAGMSARSSACRPPS